MKTRTPSSRRRLAWAAMAATSLALAGAASAQADVVTDNPAFAKEVVQTEQRLLEQVGRGTFTCGTHPVAVLGCVDASGKLWTGADLAAIVDLPEWQALAQRAPAGFPIAFKVVFDQPATAAKAKAKKTTTRKPAHRHTTRRASHR